MATSLECLVDLGDRHRGRLAKGAGRSPGRPKGSVNQNGLTVRAVRNLAPQALEALEAGLRAHDLGAVAIWARIACPAPKAVPIDAPIEGWPDRPCADAESCAQAAGAVASAVGRGELNTDEAKALLEILTKAALLSSVQTPAFGEGPVTIRVVGTPPTHANTETETGEE